jgi:uncharacterized protein (TIGR04255 family)
MIPHLPKKLNKEPLIDVVFELRFLSSQAGTAFLPSLLYSNIKGLLNIEPLPSSQLPKELRDTDPRLMFSPLNRIWWGDFVLLIGDRSLAVGCRMPYPGWTIFKSGIQQILDVLKNANQIIEVQRYSLKYVDFFETDKNHLKAISNFKLELKVGSHRLAGENLALKIEIPRKNFLHAVQFIAESGIQTESRYRLGSILEVDSICNLSGDASRVFFTNSTSLLDDIHDSNKEMFFECLSDSGLRDLEPIYE